MKFKEIWITVKELKKMQKIVDDTYYNLCRLGLYWDVYYKLQDMHWLLDGLLDWEYLDEDEKADVYCFYENNFKTI